MKIDASPFIPGIAIGKVRYWWEIRYTIDCGIANGSMKAMNDTERGSFADAIWLVALFWLNYLEVGGVEVNESTLRRGSDVLRTVLQPYLTGEILPK